MSPKENNKKVSAAVRILHQKRDASARATHLMVKNDSLITYESGILGQAAVKKFFIATFLERKIMSTKTSFKRIALVAASALAIAGFSAVPANADAVTAAGIVEQITLAKVTSAPTANAAVAVNLGLKVGDLTGETDADTLNIRGYLSAYPSSGFAQVTASETATGTDSEIGVDAQSVDSASSSSYVITFTDSSAMGAGETVTATSAVGIGKYSFTPAVAGDYTLTVWADSDGDSVVDIGEAVQTLVITVAARSGVSPALSTVLQSTILIPAAGDFGPTTASDTTIGTLQPALCAKGTAQCSNLLVTVLNTAGAAISTGWTFGAEISGTGNLGITDTDGTFTQAASSRSVSITTPANNIFNVSIFGDNTTGVGTVTVYATDADGVKTTLATKKVTFFGTVAKLALTQNYSILQAGKGTATGIITGLTATSDTPAVSILATDSAGNPVGGLSISATAADITVVSGGTVAEGLVARDAGYVYGGIGNYVADVVPSTSSVSGGKTVVTYSTTLSTGAKITTTATYTIGGTVSAETLTFDKASYSAGEAVNLTITAKDSAGNPVFDGAASPAVTFNKATGGSAVTASTYTAGSVSTTSSKGVASLFAPSIGGDLVAQATSGNTAKTVLTATASVEGDQSSSLALDAANAATDAANNAYDEAQNATQAASDALAAVTELAAQVTSLIASVKKLTAAVAKLSKKK